MGKGFLEIRVLTTIDGALPVANAHVKIIDNDGMLLYETNTDENGLTKTFEIAAPDVSLTLDPNYNKPAYSKVKVEVSAPGFMTQHINGVQIVDTQKDVLDVHMLPLADEPNPVKDNYIDIPDIGLLTRSDSTQIQGTNTSPAGRARSQVIIPDYIRVHLGVPSNTSARTIRVGFADYIKSVTCSEIYSTWPRNSLIANIHAIVTLALNRIFTEWYPSRGYSYDITNSTQYDMAYHEGVQAPSNINELVDEYLNAYAHRENYINPWFTIFCAGASGSCQHGGMSQWGTVTLANQGLTPLQILRRSYPNDLVLTRSNNIQGITETFPGTNLTIGSSGDSVRRIQNYLNRIRVNFPGIPRIDNPNGVFGQDTAAAVRVFQQVYNLTQDGIVGRATWNQITRVYVGVTRLAELDSEGKRYSIGNTPPNVVLSQGSRGPNVLQLQFLLNFIAEFYNVVPTVIKDSVFDARTRNAVIEFQRNFGLNADGVVGPLTWSKLYSTYHGINNNVVVPPPPPEPPFETPPYPGTPLRLGSSGTSVRTIQEALNVIGRTYPNIPYLEVDAQFGARTEQAVIAFQQQFGLTPDGIVGPITWDEIMRQYAIALGYVPPSTQPPTPQPPPPVWPPYPGVDLRPGMQGPSIVQVQERLNELGVAPPLRTDGVFDAATESAVIAFQSANDLAATGVINEATWNTLFGENPNPPQAEYFLYTVVAGDNLWTIAQRFGTTMEAIMALNGLTSTLIFPGQVLRIPGREPTPPPAEYFNYTVQPGDNLWTLGQRFGTTMQAIMELNGMTSDVIFPGQVIRIPGSNFTNHTVVAGDNLWTLGQRFGTTMQELMRLNSLTSDVIFPGQILVVPSSGGGVTPPPPPPPPPPSVRTIVIDAGHGGSDSGAVNGSRFEKNDNLRLALAVQKLLEAQGQRVVMTRSTDTNVTLAERSAISNRNNADLFVSIHRNWNTNPAANGFDNFVYTTAAGTTVQSAFNVMDEVVNAGVQTNRGVHRANFAVLRNTQAPAMLVEMGFISNAQDNVLFDQNFDAYAAAIARGIMMSNEVPSTYFFYTLASGETLWTVAQRFNTTIDAIVRLNGLTTSSVSTGQVLKIPR